MTITSWSLSGEGKFEAFLLDDDAKLYAIIGRNEDGSEGGMVVPNGVARNGAAHGEKLVLPPGETGDGHAAFLKAKAFNRGHWRVEPTKSRVRKDSIDQVLNLKR